MALDGTYTWASWGGFITGAVSGGTDYHQAGGAAPNSFSWIVSGNQLLLQFRTGNRSPQGYYDRVNFKVWYIYS